MFRSFSHEPARPHAVRGSASLGERIAGGRAMPFEIMAAGILSLGRRIASAIRWQRRRPAPVETPLEPLANSLAAIRSAAEILRDTPDLDASDRRRFAGMLLAEEARLEDQLDRWRRAETRAARRSASAALNHA